MSPPEEEQAFDLSRAPFHRRADADPFEVAEEITACFGVASTLSRKLTQSARAAVAVVGLAPEDPLFRAVDALACDIDAGIGDGADNPYHNSQHFCEVLLSALYLSLLAALPKAEQAQLLIAALAHDFHHDGKTVQGMPFRLERVAVESTMPYLEAAAVPRGECARVAALILATEVSVAVPFARQCYRHFFVGAERPRVPKGEPRLAMLAADARLALQAVLLTEADVLPSVGLTVAYGELSQANLSQEWGRTLGAADKLFFLEQVFGDFTAGCFFTPNLERLKQAMRARVEDG